MQRILLLIVVLLLHITSGRAQTLSETQMRNARATGYAVVAARNPGVSFSILMIPWDGINTLEYNAQTQINTTWHAQAAVKGNYFSYPFDGEDFSNYSTVITSQQEFDVYKSAGTQWWIVCSTLPSFSNCSYIINSETFSVSNNGRVGIGIFNPAVLMHIHQPTTTDTYLHLTNASTGASSADGLELSSNNDLGANVWNYENSYLRFATNNTERIRIAANGHIGIGTTDPGNYRLAVNGDIKAKKLVVTQNGWADYVFKPGYTLQPLQQVAKFIKDNNHLPGIPSAEDVEKKGLDIGLTQALLLKKIEELTLYVIQLKKTKPSY